ncbi:MAG: calcium/sodium antiporter, partial [Phycisphaerales bacterium]
MPQQVAQLITAIPPLTLIIGIALLLLGGQWLVEGSVRIARRMGVSTLLIGLTVVAFGTSSPELAFNITAAINGNGELSFGNVVGSNIANIALVLGVAALIGPLVVHGRVVKKELPLLILVSVAMLFLGLLTFTRIPAAGGGLHGYTLLDGVILLGLFGLFTWLWYDMGKQDRSDPLTREAAEELASEAAGSLFAAILLFVIGLAGLVAGGKLAEVGATGVAQWLGLSNALIGLTIVAVATSLPELVTSVIACRKGHNDLAVGNIVGSNLFNILLVLGATCLFGDVPVPAP